MTEYEEEKFSRIDLLGLEGDRRARATFAPIAEDIDKEGNRIIKKNKK